MDLNIILLLIFLNGLFAMAEIAVVSSRKSKLLQEANEGSKQAEAALKLAESPSEFLSTIQIGITFFTILAGIFGGGELADSIAQILAKNTFLAPYSKAIGLAVVVGVLSFLYLILGELVPKRLALNYPERIAKLIALPMKTLSQATSPLVWLLSASTNLVLKTLHIKEVGDTPVSEEEMRILINEGEKAGVFEAGEKEILVRSLNLSNKKVSSLMIPRKEIVWLDFDCNNENIRNKFSKNPFSYFPVCRGTIDQVVGIVKTENLITDFLNNRHVDLKKELHKPLFIPESIDCLSTLELFKNSVVNIGIVVDEYGNVQGLLTLADVVEALVGNMQTTHDNENREIVKRRDETYFVDGMVPVDRFKEYFHIKKLTGDDNGEFYTLGGLVTKKIGRIPVTGDSFEQDKFRFEVVDMDGNRVDKVLISVSQNSGVKGKAY